MRKTYLMRCMLIAVILMLLLALVSCGLTSNKTRKNSNNTNTPENNENSNSENGNGENGGNNSGSNGGNENLTPSEELLNIIKSFEYYIDIFGTLNETKTLALDTEFSYGFVNQIKTIGDEIGFNCGVNSETIDLYLTKKGNPIFGFDNNNLYVNPMDTKIQLDTSIFNESVSYMAAVLMQYLAYYASCSDDFYSKFETSWTSGLKTASLFLDNAAVVEKTNNVVKVSIPSKIVGPLLDIVTRFKLIKNFDTVTGTLDNIFKLFDVRICDFDNKSSRTDPLTFTVLKNTYAPSINIEAKYENEHLKEISFVLGFTSVIKLNATITINNVAVGNESIIPIHDYTTFSQKNYEYTASFKTHETNVDIDVDAFLYLKDCFKTKDSTIFECTVDFKKANKPAYIKITGEGIYVYLKGVMQAFNIDTSGYTTEYNYVFSESIGDMIVNLAHKFKYTQPEEGETSIGIATIFNAALKAIYAVIDNVERIIEKDVDEVDSQTDIALMDYVKSTIGKYCTFMNNQSTLYDVFSNLCTIVSNNRELFAEVVNKDTNKLSVIISKGNLEVPHDIFDYLANFIQVPSVVGNELTETIVALNHNSFSNLVNYYLGDNIKNFIAQICGETIKNMLDNKGVYLVVDIESNTLSVILAESVEKYEDEAYYVSLNCTAGYIENKTLDTSKVDTNMVVAQTPIKDIKTSSIADCLSAIVLAIKE